VSATPPGHRDLRARTRRWARSARYLVDDVGYVAGRARWRARARWAELGRAARARVLAGAGALGALLALLIAWLALAPILPCSFPGGEACPPRDEARELVPATALAYVHLSGGGDNPQYEDARALAARLPALAPQLTRSLLGAVSGREGSALEGELGPWFDGEAAVALLPSGPVELLSYGEERGARSYAEGVAPDAERDEHRGVELHRGEATAWALLDGFLALGPEEALRELIDAARGEDVPTLAEDELAAEALGELPSERLAEAYLSPDGIESLIAEGQGALASLEPFVDAGASRGAALALSADGDALELTVRSLLEPARAEAGGGGFFSAFRRFEPRLPERLPGDAIAWLGFGAAGGTASRLLDQATAQAPDLAAGLARAVTRLRSAEGVDVERDLVAALGGEAALAVVPRRAGAEEGAAHAAPAGIPFVEFVAASVDAERALEALARLQRPLARELGRGLGAPGFEQLRLGGVTAQVLDVSRAVRLAYATVGDALVVANDPEGIERFAVGEGGLDRNPNLRAATEGLPQEPSLVAYLDLAALIGLAEQEGLAEDPAYVALAGDLDQLRALGLAVVAEPDLLATDARLVLAERGEGD
jgi:hypothetical protein